MSEAVIDCLLAWSIPFSVSLLLTLALIRWSPRLGLVDLPSARKVHTQPTPKGGGLAIFAAVIVGSLCLSGALEWKDWLLLLLGGVIAALGLVDDLLSLSWQLRLSTQTLIAIAAVFALPLRIPWMAAPLAILWIVALTNAFNMLDNMDGLSAGVAYVASATCALAAGYANGSPIFFLIVMGGVLGFLWFNLSPARIFMGDAGSTFLGFVLGARTLQGDLFDHAQPGTWVVPALLLAVPLYDLTTVVMLRLAQGRSPFHADKQHLSHRLVHLGLNQAASVCVIHLLAVASGVSALLLCFGQPVAIPLLLAQVSAWWLALSMIEYFPFLNKSRKNELNR